MRVVLLMLFAPLIVTATEPRKPKMRFWKASALVLAGALAADTASSWGRPELNPLVRGGGGRFDARSFGIKAGIAGGGLAIQYFLLKRSPQAERAAAYANFTAAGTLGYAAARNWSFGRTH
ncbi:MAG: hypothetical protein SFV18_07370 [Bryobacteraceae bacterium]|nr:hypothetical protein [Bryobacteraceae bacterium]